MEQKTAIILGATGLTGSLLLKKLIADDTYSKIKLFSRKSTFVSSRKVVEFVGDLFQLENFKKDFTGDVVFCCIGTTKAKTKDKEVYKAIDYGIPLAAAKLAKANDIPTFMVISAIGANPKSNIFYNRTKGEMEQAVLEQELPNTHILRPSLIVGDRNGKRTGESVAAFMFKLTNPIMVGGLKKYKAINADTIAQAMKNLAESPINEQIIESDRIAEIGETK